MSDAKVVGDRKEFPEAVFSFGLKFETMHGLFIGTFRHHVNHFELSGNQLAKDMETTIGPEKRYIISYNKISVVDCGSLEVNGTNKMALECSPMECTNQDILVKLYIKTLTEIDLVATQLINHNIKITKGDINHFLHSKYFLKYYSSRVRYALFIISKSYKTMVAFGVLFFMTDLISYVPDVSAIDVYDTAMDLYEKASMETPVIAGVLALMLSPFLFVLVLPVCLAMVLAKKCVTVLLSMTVLEHLETLLGVVKDCNSVIKNSTRFWSKANKSKKEVKYQ
eukprot:CFRG6367T1